MGGRLAGKRVLIAGSSGAIGRAVAARFADEGARLVLVDADERELTETAATLAALGADVYPRVIEMHDEAAVSDGIGAAVEAWGGLDIVVINADFTAVAGEHPLQDLDLQRWRSSLESHLTPAFLSFKYGMRGLQRSGGGNMICALFAVEDADLAGPDGAHAASAAALQALVQVLARHYRDDAVRVNAIIAGRAATAPAVEAAGGEAAPGSAVGRPSAMSAIAETTVELALDDVSGRTLIAEPPGRRE